jgi:hypothetical protein
MTLSWAPEAITDSRQWAGNRLRFATKEEAETYLAELSLVRNTRVVESSDPVNYRPPVLPAWADYCSGQTEEVAPA